MIHQEPNNKQNIDKMFPDKDESSQLARDQPDKVRGGERNLASLKFQ